MHFPLFELLQGIGIGLIISLPLGPIGIIVMKRTIESGIRAGSIAGIAIVTVDTLATITLLLGIHHSVPLFHIIPRWVLIIGGLGFFTYGALMAFGPEKKTAQQEIPWHHHFGSALLLTLSNPSTYMSFAITGMLVSRFMQSAISTKLAVASGFFIGASLWWALLITIAFTQRKRYQNLHHTQRIVGTIIMILAIITCFSSIHQMRHFANIFISFLQ